MKQTIVFRNKIYKFDIGLVLILIALALTSLFAIYNAFNLIKYGGGMSYLLKQTMWYVVGFGVMIFLCSFSNEYIFKYMLNAYYILMVMLIYLLFSRFTKNLIGISLPFAPPINGAVSWFRIPLLGSFQPSEFIKIVLIVMVAQIITKHQERFPVATFRTDLRMFWEIAKVLLPPLILIFMQPDTGLCIIIGFNIFVLVLCSGIRKRYIIGIFGFITLFLVVFFYVYFNHQDILISLLSAYRVQRIEAWLDPESYILGSSNQLYTALLSLGSAGLAGFGMQANIIAIPEAQTDFIFAAFGQCFGFIGTVYVVILCLILDLYLCKIAYNTTNKTNRFIIIGIIGMLLYQQLQNMGMIIGLLPITGITLPLISYGGSSILSYFIAFALIMNISPLSKRTIHIRRPQIRLPKFKLKLKRT